MNVLASRPILMGVKNREVEGEIADPVVGVKGFVMCHVSSQRWTDRDRQYRLPLVRNALVGGVGEDEGRVPRDAVSTDSTQGRSAFLNQNHHVRLHQLQENRPLQSAISLHETFA